MIFVIDQERVNENIAQSLMGEENYASCLEYKLNIFVTHNIDYFTVSIAEYEPDSIYNPHLVSEDFDNDKSLEDCIDKLLEILITDIKNAHEESHRLMNYV